MNFRTPVVLFVLVLAFGLVILGLAIFESDKPSSSDVLTEELSKAAVKPDQVDEVVIERPGVGTLKFTRGGKDGKEWRIDQPAAKADPFAVTAVINELLRARPTPYGELSANPAMHGLDPPGLRVILKAGDKSSTVNVGDVTRGGPRAVVFVTTSTRKRPMAVLRSDLAALLRDAQSEGKAGDLAKWTSDYRSKTIFPSDSSGPSAADEVQAVKLTSKGKTLTLSRAGGKWHFEEPKNWGDAATDGDPANPTSFTAITPLLNAVTSLRAQSGDDFIEQPKDLKEYGLEPGNPDMIKVEAELKDGQKDKPFVLWIGKKADAPAPKDAKMPPPPTSGKVFVRVEGEQGVIRATGSNLDGLAALVADPTPLRDRTLLATDKNRIDAIDVTVGGQTVKLRRRGGQLGMPGHWELYGGPGDPQRAGETTVAALLEVLTERRTIKDFPVTNDANFAGPELKAEVKLWADGIDTAPPDPKADPKAEPKLKGTPYVLQFGKKEGDSVYVRRTLPSGAKTDFTLPENVLVRSAGGGIGSPTPLLATVAKNRLDFLDPELKSFSEFAANRLTIARGAQVTEVAQDEKSAAAVGPGGWKFVQPEPMKGKDADMGELVKLLHLLAGQRAVRFIDEQPTDAKLAEYGLDPKGPVMRVTVGLKALPLMPGTPPPDADKERVYEFGKETTDGAHVYARQQGRPAVFTLAKDVSNQFANADLRDKTVVRFDRSKVKGLKLRGWFATGGVVTTLEFERKGSEWVAKVPDKFNVDPTKVNMFVALLDGLKARAFVPGPPNTLKPEYGLSPEEQGLEVTLLIEGQPGIALNIGGPADNGANFYGYTNDPAAGGSVFTVPAELFKAYKEKPAAFAKGP
jgi:hypothetical protein